MLALLLLPLWVGATIDEHRRKPVDGNRWGLRQFRQGGLITGPCGRRPCIALTFDDGPEFHTTPTLLEELSRRNLLATFFVVGHRLDGDSEAAVRNRAVLRETWQRGHLVGNHTYSHGLMDTMDEATLTRELDRTGELIEQAIGQPTFLFRAPYGALHHPRAVRAVYGRGLTPVFWAIDTNDWRVHTAEEVLANFRHELDAYPRGGVVLMHDTHPHSVAALPLILDEIEARNRARRQRGQPVYEFVGLDELWRPLGPEGPPAGSTRRRRARH